MIQYIYIIDEEDYLYNKLKEMYKQDENFCFKKVKEDELEIALKNIPELIIVNEDSLSRNITDLCNEIRENSRYL